MKIKLDPDGLQNTFEIAQKQWESIKNKPMTQLELQEKVENLIKDLKVIKNQTTYQDVEYMVEELLCFRDELDKLIYKMQKK
jgi:dTDP-glucose pyrophosphorylase